MKSRFCVLAALSACGLGLSLGACGDSFTQGNADGGGAVGGGFVGAGGANDNTGGAGGSGGGAGIGGYGGSNATGGAGGNGGSGGEECTYPPQFVDETYLDDICDCEDVEDYGGPKCLDAPEPHGLCEGPTTCFKQPKRSQPICHPSSPVCTNNGGDFYNFYWCCA